MIAVFGYKFGHFVVHINESFFVEMHDTGKGGGNFGDWGHIKDGLVAEEGGGMGQLVVAVVTEGIVVYGVGAIRYSQDASVIGSLH